MHSPQAESAAKEKEKTERLQQIAKIDQITVCIASALLHPPRATHTAAAQAEDEISRMKPGELIAILDANYVDHTVCCVLVYACMCDYI